MCRCCPAGVVGQLRDEAGGRERDDVRPPGADESAHGFELGALEGGEEPAIARGVGGGLLGRVVVARAEVLRDLGRDAEADRVEASVAVERTEAPAEVVVDVKVGGGREVGIGDEGDALDAGRVEVADGAAGVAVGGELPARGERRERERVEL